jgi:uncharacterized protein YqiB (DUF1249 family)
MLVDSHILPECIALPGSFGGLMTLYEANYINLVQIIPDLSALNGSRISRVTDDCDLHLTIEHQTRYTCDLRLSYLFGEEGDLIAEPDLVARIYFDARIAEVRSWVDSHRHEVLLALSEEFGTQLDQRWIRNMMFSKWLEYLQEKGHHFLAETALSR